MIGFSSKEGMLAARSGGSGMGNNEQIHFILPFVAFVVLVLLLYCYLDIHFIQLNYSLLMFICVIIIELFIVNFICVCLIFI
jgi:hypothetical protein